MRRGWWWACLYALLALAGGASGCVRPPLEKGVFVYAGSWDMPPAYNGNPWAPGGVGVAAGFVYEPLFLYVPRTRTFISRLGASMAEGGDGRSLTVRLRDGVRWHDGHAMTSEDVRTTFYVGYLKNLGVWSTLADVECPDARTVVFRWRRVGPLNTIRALTEPITSPTHLYARWVPPLREWLRGATEANVFPTGGERMERARTLRESLFSFQPDLPVGTGPFRLTRVSASDLDLARFDGHYDAARISVHKVRILRWGDNSVVWSYLITGEVDAAAPACPYDVAQEILRRNRGMRLNTPSDMGDFGLVFNCRRHPLAFRRALAHLLDRDAIRQVAFTFGRTITDYSVGAPPSLWGAWLTPAFLGTLTRYDLDPEKAGSLLRDAGCRSDGHAWREADGAPLAVEILAPAGQNDVVLLAEAAATQLNRFGIAAQVRAAPQDLYASMLQDGSFDLAAVSGSEMGRYDDPGVCYGRFFSAGAQLQAAAGLGDRPLLRGRPVDTQALMVRLGDVLPARERREIVETLAGVLNEHLPYLACYEKNLTVFTLDADRVTGWPAPDAPIWSACPGGLEYVFSTLLARGDLRPAP